MTVIDIYIEKMGQESIQLTDGDRTRLYAQRRYEDGERVGTKIFVQVGAAYLGIEFGDYAAVELANWLLPTMRPALDKALEDGIALNRIADELVAERDSLRQRAEAAEAKLAFVGRYGADQWRRGNAGQEPQDFEEWRRESARE